MKTILGIFVAVLVVVLSSNFADASAILESGGYGGHYGHDWSPKNWHSYVHDKDDGHHNHHNEHGHHNDHDDHDDWNDKQHHGDGWQEDHDHLGNQKHGHHNVYSKGEKNDWANYKYGGEGNHADGSSYSEGLSKVHDNGFDHGHHENSGWQDGGHHRHGHDDDNARHGDWGSHHSDNDHGDHHYGDHGGHHAGNHGEWTQK